MYSLAELHIQRKQNCQNKTLQLSGKQWSGREKGNSFWEKEKDDHSKTEILDSIWLMIVFTLLLASSCLLSQFCIYKRE